MRLRKLAWAAPLVLAAGLAHAENAGSFLEGAKLTSLARPEAAATAQAPAHHVPSATGATIVRTSAVAPAAAPVVSSESADELDSSRSSFEIRNFLTLVVALALVGWIQRRRRDA